MYICAVVKTQIYVITGSGGATLINTFTYSLSQLSSRY